MRWCNEVVLSCLVLWWCVMCAKKSKAPLSANGTVLDQRFAAVHVLEVPLQEDEIFEGETHPTESFSPQCPLDPCLHGQRACPELSLSTGCTCPPDHKGYPEPPNVWLAKGWGPHDAEIRWCAPVVAIDAFYIRYQVAAGGEQLQTPLLHHTWRHYRLEGLRSWQRYDVCVVAVNDAGESPCVGDTLEGNPLASLQTDPPVQMLLHVGLLVGCGILIVISLGLIWSLRRWRARWSPGHATQQTGLVCVGQYNIAFEK